MYFLARFFQSTVDIKMPSKQTLKYQELHAESASADVWLWRPLVAGGASNFYVCCCRMELLVDQLLPSYNCGILEISAELARPKQTGCSSNWDTLTDGVTSCSHLGKSKMNCWATWAEVCQVMIYVLVFQSLHSPYGCCCIGIYSRCLMLMGYPSSLAQFAIWRGTMPQAICEVVWPATTS